MGLRDTLARCVGVVADYLFAHDQDAVRPSKAEPGALAADIEKAHQEWLVARSFFDNVTDPRLVDYAIYSIGAAEKRYMFLLDEARRHGVQVNPLGKERQGGGRPGPST